MCHCPLNHDIVSLARPSSTMTASVAALVCKDRKKRTWAPLLSLYIFSSNCSFCQDESLKCMCVHHTSTYYIMYCIKPILWTNGSLLHAYIPNPLSGWETTAITTSWLVTKMEKIVTLSAGKIKYMTWLINGQMMTSLPTFYQAYNADKENLFGFLFLCVSGKLFGLLDICHINTVPKKSCTAF